MNKAYQYQLYPTTEQKDFFARTFGCCRFIWNAMLSDKIQAYEKDKTNLKNTPAQYKKDYPFLKEVDSLALANVQIHLQTAYKNFFQQPKVGFPKFKSKRHSKHRYTTNNQNGTIKVLENGIKLPKVGTVKAKVHRKAPEHWKLKSATVSMLPDGTYHISVLYEYERDVVSVEPVSIIGLDYKSDGLYCDSNGQVADMPKFYREANKRLVKAQRQLSRKVGSGKFETKSSNYLKQLKKVNRLHRKIANQRRDYLHKKSTEIANQYDLVCVETLNMRAMSNKGFGNGKATLDNGYGMFLNMIAYKQADRGHYLVKVDQWYPSSQLCHICGSRKKLPLSERVYKCDCGLFLDRDHNAALNIRKEGYRIFLETVA